MLAYGGHCAMTGCGVADTLEAAHIYLYCGSSSNAICNGLILRVHTLFDLYLVSVNSDS